MRPELNVLAVIPKDIGRRTPSLRWSTVVAVSHFGAVFRQLETGALIRVEGKMKISKCQSVLEQNLTASVKTLQMKRNFSFQHDDDSKRNLQSNKGAASAQVQGFGTARTESGPKSDRRSVRWPEESGVQEIPSQSDRVRTLSQGRTAKYHRVKMRLSPTKIQRCDEI